MSNTPLPRLKKMIELTLAKNPTLKVAGRAPIEVRNSDIALTIVIWQTWYGVGANEDSTIHLYRLLDLPHEDYIKRVRARFQNVEHKYLPTNPQVLAQRRIERDYWEDALGYRVTDEEWRRYHENVAATKMPAVVIDEAMDMTDEQLDTVTDLMRKGESSFSPITIQHTPAPVRMTKMRAIYLPKTYGSASLQTDEEYEIEVEQLAVGKPIKMVSPIEAVYPNLASFNKTWKVL